MNIEVIRTKMTRGEFVKKLKNDDWGHKGEFTCPHGINLEKLPVGVCKDDSVICRTCWLKAIESVKFKGEDIEVNQELWNEFVNNKLAVNCKTEDESKEFLEYCELKKLYWWRDKSKPTTKNSL